MPGARFILICAILAAGRLFGQTDPHDVIESPDHERYSRSAYEAGRRDAEKDLREHRLAIEVFGGPPPSWYAECARLLDQRYHIELKDVAGCVVDYQIVGHARGYNEVTQAEIQRLYGRDVLEETKTEVRKQEETRRK